jgi:hypothetical protein
MHRLTEEDDVVALEDPAFVKEEPTMPEAGPIGELYRQIQERLEDAGLDADTLMITINIGLVDNALEVSGRVPSEMIRELVSDVVEASRESAFCSLVIPQVNRGIRDTAEDYLYAEVED